MLLSTVLLPFQVVDLALRADREYLQRLSSCVSLHAESAAGTPLCEGSAGDVGAFPCSSASLHLG